MIGQRGDDGKPSDKLDRRRANAFAPPSRVLANYASDTDCNLASLVERDPIGVRIIKLNPMRDRQ